MYDQSKKEQPLMQSETTKHQPAKRVQIVSIKMVRESSFLFSQRQVNSSEDAYQLFLPYLKDADREHFLVACLDTKNCPNFLHVCHIGSLNASIVHPREVMKVAILSNAASILIAHNHPSNVSTPSPQDIGITERLNEAGKILGIDLLDISLFVSLLIHH
ncbi:JAB domain-containing protein [Bacillus chungangensis]|uniref:DNA repair protein RadC n=1 Tax=Bacillus chungangensis TaxID=587633 RepID=A0ABT9WVE8_9BACI|nr:JAB domain-containing protein [Bacillus chungangensis]MDQ0177151.1 DNA repair protein RadC [Bacillus chungangensis]